MKRFLMFVGVAVVAAAMYVAASPASQRSAGPTAKQFAALKKQVASLSKKLKATKSEADAAVGIIGLCYLTINGNNASFNVLPVSQFGDINTGFFFGQSGGAPTTRSALDVQNANPQEYLQEVTPGCVTGGALKHLAVRAAGIRVQHWAQRSR